MTDQRFSGRVALVTGGASGIGQATAQILAQQGAAVAVVDRDADGADRVAKEISAAGRQARAYTCDVGNSGEVAVVVAAIEDQIGPVDVVANVAGIGDTASLGGIEAIVDDRWDAVIRVNLSGPFFICRAVLPGMAAMPALQARVAVLYSSHIGH